MKNEKYKIILLMAISIIIFFLFIKNTGIMGQMVYESSGTFEKLFNDCSQKIK
jgi:hypothetical protein